MTTKKTRILIYEDGSDEERSALHQLLRAKMEDEVKIATDAQDAWEYLKNPSNEAEQLVAVFLDLEPSNLNSLHLLGQIRADPRLAHLHVVGMTTDDSPREDLAKCIEMQVITFVKKPITLRSFIKAIADSFHSSKMAAKNRA